MTSKVLNNYDFAHTNISTWTFHSLFLLNNKLTIFIWILVWILQTKIIIITDHDSYTFLPQPGTKVWWRDQQKLMLIGGIVLAVLVITVILCIIIICICRRMRAKSKCKLTSFVVIALIANVTLTMNRVTTCWVTSCRVTAYLKFLNVLL